MLILGDDPPGSKNKDVQHSFCGKVVKDAALTIIGLQVIKELFQFTELFWKIKLFFIRIVRALLPSHQAAKHDTNNRPSSGFLRRQLWKNLYELSIKKEFYIVP